MGFLILYILIKKYLRNWSFMEGYIKNLSYVVFKRYKTILNNSEEKIL